MKQTVVWLLGIGMGFLPQGNITVKISKSPPGRYLLYRYTAMYKIYVPSYFTTPYYLPLRLYPLQTLSKQINSQSQIRVVAL